MTLEVLICTFDERVKQVSRIFLPKRLEVSYLISFQYSDDKLLELLNDCDFNRDDVKVFSVKGCGLAANRNNALKNACGDILLIADDDVKYTPSFFDCILNHFETDLRLDIACFQAESFSGKPLRCYPTFSFTYKECPRGSHYILSVGLTMRRKESLPTFDERFGIGAPYLGSGEEEVFLLDAFRRGLNIRYFPEVVVKTDEQTTGTFFFKNPRVQRSKGAVLCLIHGPVKAFLKCLKFSIFHCRGHHFLKLFREMTRGILYVK